MIHEKYHYHSMEEIQQKAGELGAFLPMQEDLSPLFQPLTLGKHTAANRIALQPMEGSDGLEDCTHFILYIPGTPASQLPDGMKYWLHGAADSGTLNCYALYNTATGDTFIS